MKFEFPNVPARQTGPVKAWFEPVVIPTYHTHAPDKKPIFLENRAEECRPSRVAGGPAYICLDTYMLSGVYQEHGICVRNHCGAEPPRDIEPARLVATVGWRDRASASHVAADRVKAPASAARGRVRGIHGGRTAPSLPAET